MGPIRTGRLPETTADDRKMLISNGAPPNDVSLSAAGSGSISKRKSASAGEAFGVLRKCS
jgi:hypothetical protein